MIIWDVTNAESFFTGNALTLTILQLNNIKKNPYIKWRCPICTDKYCIQCNKVFSKGCLESIYCDRCTFWYHVGCTDLSKSEFKHLSSLPSEKWKCKSCTDKFCKRCDKNTYNKPKSRCCVCSDTFHLSCLGIPAKTNKEIINSWLCQNCKTTVFPYATIDNSSVIQ